jgi:hypothetical protein
MLKPGSRRRQSAAASLVGALAALAGVLMLVACGSGARPASTEAPVTAVTIDNQTPCVLHIRFDNGAPRARVLPGERQVYSDEHLPAYGFMQVESTMAIFRTYPMDAIRDRGNVLVVRPVADDHPCYETP